MNHFNRGVDNQQQQMQPQNHQQAYFLNLQQQQQQRNQAMQLQHQQIQGSHNMSSMQHNFMTPTQQQHQQIQQQIRSPTPPHQGMLQHRQQAFQQHGIMHGMHGIQHQQNSPQPHFQSQQSPRPIIRTMNVNSPQQHQQSVVVTQQQLQQQQHYMQFARPSEVSPMVPQSQFIQQSNPQFVNGNNVGNVVQGQHLRQMLIPQSSASPVFRHNVVIQREQPKSGGNAMRFPSQPATPISSTDKLSPQQELHVLQQNYSGAHIQHHPNYSTGNEQQQRFLQQQQQIPSRISVVHSHHQSPHQIQPNLSASMGVGVSNQVNAVSAVSSSGQLMTSNSGGNMSTKVPVFVTSHNQQQQVYFAIQQQQKPSSVSSITDNNDFASSSFMNVQKNGTPTSSILLNDDGVSNNGRASSSNQSMMEQHLNGSSGTGNFVFLHPKSDHLMGQHGNISGQPSPSSNVEMLQSESPGNTIAFEGSSSSNIIPSISSNKKKASSKQSLAKSFQQKNINNVGNSLGNNSTINVSATNNKHFENNLNNDLIKASIPSQSTIKLLDRETFDSFVKTVDPNEVLEDEVSDALQLVLEDFVDEIIRNSVDLCKHRGSTKLEAKDVHFVLANKMKLDVDTESNGISSVGSSNNNNSGAPVSGGTSTFFQQSPASKRAPLIAHQQRMALINKTIKKL
uniref:Transcription initiation factor TFIID subunit 12 n=2 Tax=Meloidogyne TaxID=189290 RepID=A0A914M3C3_MELIC